MLIRITWRTRKQFVYYMRRVHQSVSSQYIYILFRCGISGSRLRPSFVEFDVVASAISGAVEIRKFRTENTAGCGNLQGQIYIKRVIMKCFSKCEVFITFWAYSTMLQLLITSWLTDYTERPFGVDHLRRMARWPGTISTCLNGLFESYNLLSIHSSQQHWFLYLTRWKPDIQDVLHGSTSHVYTAYVTVK